MKNIVPIVNSLDNKEKRLIRKFLSIKTNGMEKKKLQLFDLIVNQKVASDKEASFVLYQSEPNSSFSHLKKRLKKDLLNFILLQDSKNISSERVKSEIECRRMFLQGQLLVQRGVYSEGERVLNDALKLAESYEMFAEILVIRDYLRTTSGFRKGIETYQKYTETMDYQHAELGKWLKVRQYYYQVSLLNEFKGNKKINLEHETAAILKDLDAYDEKESSERFLFWFYVSKMHNHNISKEFVEADRYARNLLNLFSEDSMMKTKSNQGGVLKDVVYINLNLGNHKDAVKYANQAIDNFRKGMVNELRAMDYLFFAHLRNQDYANAETTIQKALQHKQINAGNKLIKARWLFFQSNLEYLKGNHKEAARSLRTNDHITSDKSGWNLGCRLLEMMIDMEENDLFLVDYKLKNFNRLLSPKNTQTENIERARLIARVIRLFIKHRGNFNETFEIAKNEIQALEDGDGQLFWDPMGYEVIRFDKWFRDKRDAKNNPRKPRKFSASRPS